MRLVKCLQLVVGFVFQEVCSGILFAGNNTDSVIYRHSADCFNKNRHNAGGAGFASRLVVDGNGDIKSEMCDVNNQTQVGNFDLAQASAVRFSRIITFSTVFLPFGSFSTVATSFAASSGIGM